MYEKTVPAMITLIAAGCLHSPNDDAVEVDPPEGAYLAAMIATYEWEKRLDLEPGYLGDFPEIRWFDNDCMPSDRYDGCPNGYFMASPLWGSEIWLLYREDIHRSALAHELLHWALYEITGDPDGDHEHDLWSEQSEVMDTLAEYGL